MSILGGVLSNRVPNLTVTGVLSIADGTAAAPSLTFSGDTDSGLYRIGANNVGLSLGGAVEFDFSATALNLKDNILYGSSAASGDLDLRATSHATTTTSYLFFGTAAQGQIYMIGGHLNSIWGTNDDSQALVFNYEGYQGGATRFRDTRIYNGKGGDMSWWDGSAANLTHAAGLNVCINAAVPETGSTGTLAFKNGGTAPNAVVADQFQIYAADVNGGGTTGLCYYGEQDVGASVATASTHSLPVLINGALFKILLSNV